MVAQNAYVKGAFTKEQLWDIANNTDPLLLKAITEQKSTIDVSDSGHLQLRLALLLGRHNEQEIREMAGLIDATSIGDHSRYANDRFVVTHCFNLHDVFKERANKDLLRNAMAGYLEHTTSGGYNHTSLMNAMGLINSYPHTEPASNYFGLKNERVLDIAHKLGVTDEQLVGIAADVIHWCLQGHGVRETATFYCAGTYIDLDQAKALAFDFLPAAGQATLRPYFKQAAINLQQAGGSYVKPPNDYPTNLPTVIPSSIIHKQKL